MSFTAPITQFAEDAYVYLEPVWADDDQRGYPLKIFMAGIGEGGRQVEEAVRAQPGRQPYQQVYDITQTPDFLLDWIGFFVGQDVTGITDPDAKRTAIQAEAGFYRGSVGNLIAAVAATQTSDTAVTVEEDTPDAWGIAVLYDPAYTPDPTATANAAAAAKAWGLALTVTSGSISSIDEGTLTIDAASGTVDTATLADIT